MKGHDGANAKDIMERLEVLVCRAMGVHKACDACEVLNTNEVLNESVA